MGMYDYIDFKTNCPRCGEIVSGFQSKDLDCELKTYSPLCVDYFYGSCLNCQNWITYSREHVAVERGSIKDFKITCE